MTARPDKPIDQWASTDVLAAVVDVEIAAAARIDAAAARRLYEHTLGGQKASGYAEPHRVDPGGPEL